MRSTRLDTAFVSLDVLRYEPGTPVRSFGFIDTAAARRVKLLSCTAFLCGTEVPLLLSFSLFSKSSLKCGSCYPRELSSLFLGLIAELILIPLVYAETACLPV